MVAHGMAPSGERFVIEQGEEMRRPGELYVTAVKAGSGAREVRVGGYCVRAGSGEMTL